LRKGGNGEKLERKAVSGVMLMLLLISMLTLAFNIQPVKAGPATIYVDDDNTSGPWDGTPEHPYQNITSGLEHALDGDTIFVFNGTYYENVVANKLVSLLGENMATTIIDGGTVGTVVSITVDGVNVTGFTMRNSGSISAGIDLSSASHCNISGNNIAENDYGIYLYDSSNNSISGNKITANSLVGIYLYDSSNNSISGNNIAISWYGIILEYFSNYNIISGNNITNNGGGIWLFDSSNTNNVSGNNITNNSGNGIWVGYSSNSISGNKITNNHYGIYLYYSSNNNVSGNEITNNGRGIWLFDSSYSSISGNNITNNRYGIVLEEFSTYNIISGNNITNNEVDGIYLFVSSSDNSIYHNNFIDNIRQVEIVPVGLRNAWDDGYPSGGNCWSDYTGVDEYGGPNQDQPGSDGICDTPYIINNYNRDRYPLMKPYGGPVDIGITNITTSKILVGQGYNLNVNIKITNYGISSETFNVTVYANTTVIALLTDITLSTRNSTTITFTWNTAGFAKGNYTIKAVAEALPGETDTTDNTLTDGWVLVTIPGDINADQKVNILDCIILANHFGHTNGNGHTPSTEEWQKCLNSDINSDNKVNILDCIILAGHFGQEWL